MCAKISECIIKKPWRKNATQTHIHHHPKHTCNIPRPAPPASPLSSSSSSSAGCRLIGNRDKTGLEFHHAWNGGKHGDGSVSCYLPGLSRFDWGFSVHFFDGKNWGHRQPTTDDQCDERMDGWWGGDGSDEGKHNAAAKELEELAAEMLTLGRGPAKNKLRDSTSTSAVSAVQSVESRGGINRDRLLKYASRKVFRVAQVKTSQTAYPECWEG